MQSRNLVSSVLASLILALFTSFASATTISLNDIPANYRYQNLPLYSEAGFNISVNCTNCVNVFSTDEAMSGYGASTEAANWGADERFLETWNTSAIFSLTLDSGFAFDLVGLDIGWFNNSTSNASWSVRAFDKDGNQIAPQDNYTGIGTFVTDYYDVYKVELQNNGGFSSFDNLQVVPEPEGVMLLGCALLLLSFSRRQKAKRF